MRDARLAVRIASAAGREVNRQIEHRQIAVLDEKHPRTLRRLPVLDSQPSVGSRDDANQQQQAEKMLNGHG
jgi:hypothetical protein